MTHKQLPIQHATNGCLHYNIFFRSVLCNLPTNE